MSLEGIKFYVKHKMTVLVNTQNIIYCIIMVTVIDQNISTLASEKSGKKMISWIVLYILPTVKQVEE